MVCVTLSPTLNSTVNDSPKITDPSKEFRASGLDQVRRLTAVTAAITLALLSVEMLCYVLGRLHSSCVLRTRIGPHRIVLDKTLVNDNFSKKKFEFSIYLCLKS